MGIKAITVRGIDDEMSSKLKQIANQNGLKLFTKDDHFKSIAGLSLVRLFLENHLKPQISKDLP